MASLIDSTLKISRKEKSRFSIKKFTFGRNDPYLHDELPLHQILNCFWAGSFGTHPGCAISSFQVDFTIESVEVITNVDLQENYENMKAELIDGHETILFHGVENHDMALGVAKANFKLTQFGLKSGIALYKNPMIAMTQGTTLIASKVVLPKSSELDQKEETFVMSKRQVSPIGIINLDFELKPLQKSPGYDNSRFAWNFIIGVNHFKDVYLDIDMISKEVMAEITKLPYSEKALHFMIDFVQARTDICELLTKKEYKTLRDAEDSKRDESIEVTFHLDKAQKFLEFIDMKTIVSKDFQQKVLVRFLVNDENTPKASLILKMFMRVEKQSNDPDVAATTATQLVKIMKKLEVKIPSPKKKSSNGLPPIIPEIDYCSAMNWANLYLRVKPPIFQDCGVCSKIDPDETAWIQIQCGHYLHCKCLKKLKHYMCPNDGCEKALQIEVGNQPSGRTPVVRYNEAKSQRVLQYTFQDGIQNENHPNPGEKYQGEKVQIILPNIKHVNEVIECLTKIFSDKMLCVIGENNRVILNPIISSLLGQQDLLDNPKKFVKVLEAYFF